MYVEPYTIKDKEICSTLWIFVSAILPCAAGRGTYGISNERRRERVPSGRTSEDTYEMSDDDLVSKKTGA